MSADAAKGYFRGNVALFGKAQEQPEKFNLYNGLASLADAVDDIERMVKTIQHELSSIKARLR